MDDARDVAEVANGAVIVAPIHKNGTVGEVTIYVAVHGRILPTARTSCVREWPTLRYEWEYRQEAAQVVSGSRLGLG